MTKWTLLNFKTLNLFLFKGIWRFWQRHHKISKYLWCGVPLWLSMKACGTFAWCSHSFGHAVMLYMLFGTFLDPPCLWFINVNQNSVLLSMSYTGLPSYYVIHSDLFLNLFYVSICPFRLKYVENKSWLGSISYIQICI